MEYIANGDTMKFLKYFTARTFVLILTVFIGVTIVFFLARIMPTDPVESMISQIQEDTGYIDPDALEEMRQVMNQTFGLDGTLWEQYTGFLGRAILSQNYGPSISYYPTTVGELIAKALPWTMGLLLTSVIIAWLVGNIIGLLAGFRKDKLSSKILETISIVLYPLPYYVLALVLIMVFAYIIPIFPLTTNVRGSAWTWEYIKSLIHNSLLPAVSLILIDLGWWALSMKTLSIDACEEDYITFAKMKGLSKRKIMWGYLAPNAMLPQVTSLALRLGRAFGGAVIVEILFCYPGMGTLIYNAIMQADYNLIIGTITISILAVSVATYIIDLTYPLLDPRIRNK